MAAEQQEDTIFHKIMRKEIPSSFVYEDDTCFAIKDIAPVAPIHYLIIPRKTIKNLAQAEEGDEKVLGHLLYVASKIAKQEKLDEGYRVCINTNAHACQTVFQLHVHLIGGKQLSIVRERRTLKFQNKNIATSSTADESKRLYKSFMKLTRKIEDKQHQKDLRYWIRDDFRINKNLTDETDIKSQHIRARTALEELEISIDLSRAKNDGS